MTDDRKYTCEKSDRFLGRRSRVGGFRLSVNEL